MDNLLPYFLISISISCTVFYSLLSKLSGNRLVLFGALNGLAVFFALFLIPFVPVPSASVALVILASSACYCFMIYFMAKTYENADLRVMSPLIAAFKYFILITVAVFIFEENVTNAQWIGILGIGVGILVQADFSRVVKIKDNKGLLFIFLTACGTAAQTSFDIYGIRISENPYSYIVWLMFIGAPVTVFALYKHKRETFKLVKEQWKQIVMCSIFDNLGYLCLLLVMYGLKVLYVLPLMNLTTVVTTLVGIFFLKEAMASRRIISSIIIFISIAWSQIA